MNVVMATEPGNPTKPNEDWCGSTGGVAVVLDGVTSPPELTTGCRHGVPWYVAKLGAAFVTAAGKGAGSLAQALESAITEVRALHQDTCDLDSPGTPSATVAAARWTDPDSVELLVLSDATAVVEVSGRVYQVLSDRRLDRVAMDQRAQIKNHPIGSYEHYAALLDVIHEQRRWHNRPGGYWLAAATPAAAGHAVTAVFPAADVRAVALMSDGAACLVDDYKSDTWEGVLTCLKNEGPVALIRRVRELEEMDAEGTTWTRYKASDDATAIYLGIG